MQHPGNCIHGITVLPFRVVFAMHPVIIRISQATCNTKDPEPVHVQAGFDENNVGNENIRPGIHNRHGLGQHAPL
jgi:hypothetical protein